MDSSSAVPEITLSANEHFECMTLTIHQLIFMTEESADVKLKCEVHDVTHAVSYEVFAHLLYFSSEATSLTVVF